MTPNLTTIGNDDDDLNVIFDWAGRRSEHGDDDKATVAVATEMAGGAILAPASSVGDAVAAPTATSDDDISGGSQQHHQEVILSAGASDSDRWGPLPWMSDACHHYHHSSTHHAANATASYDYYFKDHVDVIDFDASDCDDDDDDDAFFEFARSNYMESIRTWTCGGSQSHPTAITNNATPGVPSSSLLLPMAMDMNTSIDVANDSEDDDGNNDECCPPGMVRTTSGSLSSEETADDDDETMSNASTTSSDSDAASEAEEEEDEQHQPPVLPPPQRGVTFNEQVRVLPIPPIEHYTPEQRYKMYANRVELRQNKLRNKREYEFDNYDWRNATEEHSMAICPVSGELLHPAHL